MIVDLGTLQYADLTLIINLILEGPGRVSRKCRMAAVWGFPLHIPTSSVKCYCDA